MLFEDDCLLGCCTIITLIMDAARTSETLVNVYQTTQRDLPEDSHLHIHCCENLQFHRLHDVISILCCRLLLLHCI
jgi:hypothetical protein